MFARRSYRIHIAERLVLAAIALRQLDDPVVVLIAVVVICHIADVSRAASAAERGLERRLDAGPDLDARAVRGVRHADVVDVDILDDVKLLDILAKRPDTDTY